jgi:hypothetical protein
METTSVDNDNVILPILEFGYRTTPCDWTELLHILSSNELALLSRNATQQHEYEIAQKRTLETYKTMYDFIRADIFGIETILDSEDNKLYTLPSSKVQTVLKPNDFPYFFTETIQHWILYVKTPAIAPAEFCSHGKFTHTLFYF